MRKEIVEQFCYIHSVFVKAFVEAKEHYKGIPSACLIIGLYYSPVAKIKILRMKLALSIYW
jgi:hypothetical protein